MPPSADVTVRSPVYDTERRKRVLRAITNIFPDGEVREIRDRDHLRHGEELVVDAEDLEGFAEHVERQDIGPTVRSALLDGATGHAVAVRLKKQAAFVDRLNVAVGGHELGALDVRIETDDPEALVDRLAPAADLDGQDEGGAER